MSRDEGVIEREVFIKAPPETVFKFLSEGMPHDLFKIAR
jgi:uncharacterized protein YndB with AHSA1/START domain